MTILGQKNASKYNKTYVTRRHLQNVHRRFHLFLLFLLVGITLSSFVSNISIYNIRMFSLSSMMSVKLAVAEKGDHNVRHHDNNNDNKKGSDNSNNNNDNKKGSDNSNNNNDNKKGSDNSNNNNDNRQQNGQEKDSSQSTTPTENKDQATQSGSTTPTENKDQATQSDSTTPTENKDPKQRSLTLQPLLKTELLKGKGLHLL